MAVPRDRFRASHDEQGDVLRSLHRPPV